jgi:predicted nucleotidyltransferase
MDFLDSTWTYEKEKLFRAEKLYTAHNYQMFLETFRAHFPDYVYFCPFRTKEVISAPLTSVKKVYIPSACLQRLTRLKNSDALEQKALNLVKLFSKESKISILDFGVHGSVGLNMHKSNSDIDLVVYGGRNFRRLERTISRLVELGKLSYKFSNRLDTARKYKGKYLGTTFMYNAVRKPEELDIKYGQLKYTPSNLISFECKIKDDNESMFRPATYSITCYDPVDEASALPEDKIPSRVVSMVGCYRNVAKKGDKIRVTGMLEHVKNLQTDKSDHQVVVGTGTSEEEHIWPCQD